MKILLLLLVASACLVQTHAVESKDKADGVISVKGASDEVDVTSVKSEVGDSPQSKTTAEKPKGQKHTLGGLLGKVKKVIGRSKRDTTAEHKESTMGRLFSKIKSIGRKSAPKTEAGTKSKVAETKAEKSDTDETSAKSKTVTEDTKADEEEQSEKDDKVEHVRRKRSPDGESRTKSFFKKLTGKFHKSGTTNDAAPAPAPVAESKPKQKMSLTRKIFGDLDDEEEKNKVPRKRISDEDDDDDMLDYFVF